MPINLTAMLPGPKQGGQQSYTTGDSDNPQPGERNTHLPFIGALIEALKISLP